MLFCKWFFRALLVIADDLTVISLNFHFQNGPIPGKSLGKIYGPEELLTAKVLQIS